MAFDPDQAFAYRTPKIVAVKDWRLGVLSYVLMVLIVVRIGVLTIGKDCKHLLPEPVSGQAVGSIYKPMEVDCKGYPFDRSCPSDYTPMQKIPYCTQYEADDRIHSQKADEPTMSERALDDSKPLLPKQLPCQIWDGIQMSQAAPHPGFLFVPTHVERKHQAPGCEPNKSNGWHCATNPYDEVLKNSSFFLGDVERFMMLIDSVFVKSDGSTGHAGQFQGFVREATGFATLDPHAEVSIGTKASSSDAATAPLKKIPPKPDVESKFPSLQMTRKGDIISVGGLLNGADSRGKEILDIPRSDGTTIREKGAIVYVNIRFDNQQLWDPFGEANATYIYDVNILPMNEYSIIYDREGKGGRHVVEMYGLLFIFSVTGEIRKFDITYLIQVLTTAMLGLATAATLTDSIMVYVMPYVTVAGSKYERLKYQYSEDFSDYKDKLKALPTTDRSGKAHRHQRILHESCELGKAPGEQELLTILAAFDQRLNRLDCLDIHNHGEPEEHEEKPHYQTSRWLRGKENQYQSLHGSSQSEMRTLSIRDE